MDKSGSDHENCTGAEKEEMASEGNDKKVSEVVYVPCQKDTLGSSKLLNAINNDDSTSKAQNCFKTLALFIGYVVFVSIHTVLYSVLKNGEICSGQPSYYII